MISRIKKVNNELFFNFFSESRHDFRKFSPVKQVIKKLWPNGKPSGSFWGWGGGDFSFFTMFLSCPLVYGLFPTLPGTQVTLNH